MKENIFILRTEHSWSGNFMEKLNCWEYKKCGRYKGGVEVRKCGICIATTEERTNGINQGKNGGRCCWAVAGTLCEGPVQGSFATKLDKCYDCEFYWYVNTEEGKNAAKLEDIRKLLHK